MEVPRRNMLKSAAAFAGLTGISVAPSNQAWTDFSKLKHAVNKRRKLREENPGATVYLGSVDSLDVKFDGGHYYDNTDFNDVERMLEQGIEPEEILELGKDDLKHLEEDGRPIKQGEENIKIVYISEEPDRPLELYSMQLQEEFLEFQPPINLNVSSGTVIPDSQDLQLLENVSSQEGWREGIQLRNKHSNWREKPIFLVETDILPDTQGQADYFAGTAFVELTGSEQRNQYVINHEAGHSVLKLPHHFYETGVMSYNPEAFGDRSFHPRSRMVAEAILTGDTEYSTALNSAQVSTNGELREENYVQINVHHTPRELGTEAVTQDFFQHLETYLEQDLGYDMTSWRPNKHRLVVDGDTTYDLATYKHRNGPEMALKVDGFIEKMGLDAI